MTDEYRITEKYNMFFGEILKGTEWKSICTGKKTRQEVEAYIERHKKDWKDVHFFHKTDNKLQSDIIFQRLKEAELPCERFRDNDNNWVIVSKEKIDEGFLD